MRDHQPEKTDEYLTDEFSNEAVKFIEKNQKDPFFLYLAYNAPHGPLKATPRYLDRFDHGKKKKRKTYAAMVSAVAEGVGRIIERLESLAVIENHMIVFLSDNDGTEPTHGSSQVKLYKGRNSISNAGK